MIKARGLARTFKARGRNAEAVRDVDIDVAEGELEIAIQGRFYGLSKSDAHRRGAEL